MKLDHIALVVDSPADAANWYIQNFGAEKIHIDDTWAFIKFDNIKMAFVVSHQHPAHFAFLTEGFEPGDRVKKHRDDSESVYKRDPWGNIYELIKYPDEENNY